MSLKFEWKDEFSIVNETSMQSIRIFSILRTGFLR